MSTNPFIRCDSNNPFIQEMSSPSSNGGTLYPQLKDEDNEEKKPSKSQIDTYSEDISLVVKASDFAARRHRFQKRKDPHQTPYINHPIG